MPCFRTPHSVDGDMRGTYGSVYTGHGLDTIKHLTVARLWMDSSDLSEINVGFLAGLRRKYFIPYKEENLKVGEKRHMNRTKIENRGPNEGLDSQPPVTTSCLVQGLMCHGVVLTNRMFSTSLSSLSEQQLWRGLPRQPDSAHTCSSMQVSLFFAGSGYVRCPESYAHLFPVSTFAFFFSLALLSNFLPLSRHFSRHLRSLLPTGPAFIKIQCSS